MEFNIRFDSPYGTSGQDIDNLPTKDQLLYVEPFRPYDEAIDRWLRSGILIRRDNSATPKPVMIVRSGGEKSYQDIINEMRNKRVDLPVIAYRMLNHRDDMSRWIPRIGEAHDHSTSLPVSYNTNTKTALMAPRAMPVELDYTFEVWCKMWSEWNQITYWFKKQFAAGALKPFIVYNAISYLTMPAWSNLTEYEPKQDVDRLIRFKADATMKWAWFPVGMDNVKVAETVQLDFITLPQVDNTTIDDSMDVDG